MDLEQRKAGILTELLQVNLSNLITNLATVIEENEGLRAKVAELEARLAAAAADKPE